MKHAINLAKNRKWLWSKPILIILFALVSTPAHAQVGSICYPCTLTMYALSIAQGTLLAFPSELAATLWPLMVMIIGVGTLWAIMKAVSGGYSPVPDIIQTAARLAVLSCILAYPSNIGTLVVDYGLGPAMQAGSGLGAQLLTDTLKTGGFSPTENDCTSVTPTEVGITQSDLLSAANSLNTEMCAISDVGMIMYNIGGIVASQQVRSGTEGDMRSGVIYGAVGLFMMYSAFMMLIDFGLTVFETILRVSIILTFSPVIAFFWMFPATRGAVYNTFTNLFFMFVYFAMTGLGISVSITIMFIGIRLGLGLPINDTSTPTQLVTDFALKLTTGATIDDSSVFASALTFTAYTTICTMIATAVLRGIFDASREITQFQGNGSNQRTLAGAAINSVGSLVTASMTTAAGSAMTLGKITGKGIAKLFPS
jgi:hypothetical protein